MNQFQRVVWLARRNFVRGTFSNLAAIFLVSINCLVFFMWYLHRFSPNPAFSGQQSPMMGLSELLLVVLLAMNFFSLLVIFWLINRVRYHEIGLLRGIGARRLFVFKLLLVETWFIVLSGAVLSVILGFIVVQARGEVLAPFFATAGFGSLIASVGAALGSTLVAATLAALYPAIVICSVEPYTAIRNRE
ncbi:MAG TPA: FtsX-like permease family protein [Spirochaetota bacterium]|nr:FtsX-like permease family protein [Spirochaetota bacterium]